MLALLLFSNEWIPSWCVFSWLFYLVYWGLATTIQPVTFTS